LQPYLLIYPPTRPYTGVCLYTMSHRSDLCLACSSKGNIYEAASYTTIAYAVTVTQIKLRRVQCRVAIMDTTPLNTSWREDMMYSNNERFFISNISNYTFHITFDAWLVSMIVRLMRPTRWNNSRHAPSWQFLFTLCHSRDWQPQHHRYGLSSRSVPCIRIWDQLNGQTLGGKSAYRKVKLIIGVRGTQIH
jgi:hypothetical protein